MTTSRMRGSGLALAAMLAVSVCPPAADADHDRPLKASGIRVGLVRAYAPCTVPNAVHDEVLVINEACAPAVPESPYRFGPKGLGKAQIQAVTDGIKMKFSLTDVHDVGDQPTSNVTFAGRITLRLTDHGCSTATSCTVETALQINVPCDKGRCVAQQIYPGAFLPMGYEASLEVIQVDVLDSSGNRFATGGILLD